MDATPPTPDTLREEACADLMEFVAWVPAWAFAFATVVHSLRAHSPFGAEETLALAAAVLITLQGVDAVKRHARLRAASPPPEPQRTYR